MKARAAMTLFRDALDIQGTQQIGFIARFSFIENIGEVVFNCLTTDSKCSGDLNIGQPQFHQPDHFLFTLGQREALHAMRSRNTQLFRDMQQQETIPPIVAG